MEMENTLTTAYMPFTCLSEPTARLLTALVGRVVVYQPLKMNIPESLTALVSQGLVEIRTPITRDDDRLRAALAEFMHWARMNPARNDPGGRFFQPTTGGHSIFRRNRRQPDPFRHQPVWSIRWSGGA